MSLKWAMIFALYKLDLTYTFGISICKNNSHKYDAQSKLAWLTEKLECQSDIFDGSVTGFNYKGQKYSFKRHNRIIYYVPRTEVHATVVCIKDGKASFLRFWKNHP